MRMVKAAALAVVVAAQLAACGGGDSGVATSTSTAPGTLVYNPPLRAVSLTAAALTAQFSANATGAQLLQLALPQGTTQFPCGIDVHYFQYQTSGALPTESTVASGALMAPTGGVGCSGSRPILLYTHGTASTKSYNIAALADPSNEAWTESAIVAAFFAAQGYIVVAPNYAGYDVSNLPYHPYLNAAALSQDVINSLTAARSALASGLPSGDTDSGRLFITGYSEGGYVAMATHKAMQAAGMTVTGAAHMSGPYALEALFDGVMFGEVPLGSTIYGPMTIKSYAHAYLTNGVPDVYWLTGTNADVYEAAYAGVVDTLIPGPYSFSDLVPNPPAVGLLPIDLFSSTPTGDTLIDGLSTVLTNGNPVYALGFGTTNLLKNQLRLAYGADAESNPDHALGSALLFGSTPPWSTAGFTDVLPAPTLPTTFPLRKAFQVNDLRNWTPNGTAPMLLCGGHDDPEVNYALDTGVMAAYWHTMVNTAPFGSAPNNFITVLDVDPGAPVTSGGIPTQIGTIAATRFGYDLATGVTSPTTIANDVLADLTVHATGPTGSANPFAAYFTAGLPNSPQGVEVLGLASVAQGAILYYMTQATPPLTTAAQAATMGNDVAFAVTANFHFPFTQLSCTVAAKGFFAAIP